LLKILGRGECRRRCSADHTIMLLIECSMCCDFVNVCVREKEDIRTKYTGS
jgi:hypothetical protein